MRFLSQYFLGAAGVDTARFPIDRLATGGSFSDVILKDYETISEDDKAIPGGRRGGGFSSPQAETACAQLGGAEGQIVRRVRAGQLLLQHLQASEHQCLKALLDARAEGGIYQRVFPLRQAHLERIRGDNVADPRGTIPESGGEGALAQGGLRHQHIYHCIMGIADLRYLRHARGMRTEHRRPGLQLVEQALPYPYWISTHARIITRFTSACKADRRDVDNVYALRYRNQYTNRWSQLRQTVHSEISARERFAPHPRSGTRAGPAWTPRLAVSLASCMPARIMRARLTMRGRRRGAAICGTLCRAASHCVGSAGRWRAGYPMQSMR